MLSVEGSVLDIRPARLSGENFGATNLQKQISGARCAPKRATRSETERTNTRKLMAIQAPDLTQRPPRSPRVRLGGYALLPRMLDKGRATIIGKNGDYNYNCPLDQRFVNFVGIDAEALKQELAAGKGDGEVLEWITANAKFNRTDSAGRNTRIGALRTTRKRGSISTTSRNNPARTAKTSRAGSICWIWTITSRLAEKREAEKRKVGKRESGNRVAGAAALPIKINLVPSEPV